MAIKNLIDGQTIEIDDHNRCCAIEWGKGIHLHKRMNSDTYNGAEVLIYINDDKDLEFRSLQGRTSDIERHIKNEIKNEFKNPSKRRDFIKSFYKSLDEILKNNGYDINKRYEIAEAAATRIARYFDLKPKIIRSFGNLANNFFIQFENFVIKENVNDHSFTVGKDLENTETFEPFR